MKTDETMKTYLQAFMEKDAFARHLGIELTEVTPGRAVARMSIGGEHLNGMDTAHGGAVFSLADTAFAAASNSRDQAALAVSVHISYMKKTRIGETLVAVAEENSVNPRLGHYTITVSDVHGEPVAVFQGLAYRKKEKYDPAAQPQ